jgi:hypothetical protein
MAFIAPSLWTVNQYGEGLRRLVRRGRHLDRWLDFKSHQIFEDVITYTALQFYTHEPRDEMRIAAAPDGEMADVDWSDAYLAVSYDALPDDGEWLMATGPERALIKRLGHDCLRLDDPSLTTAIFQGLVTSAAAPLRQWRRSVGQNLSRRGGRPLEPKLIGAGFFSADRRETRSDSRPTFAARQRRPTRTRLRNLSSASWP